VLGSCIRLLVRFLKRNQIPTILAILGGNGQNPFFRSKRAQNGPFFPKIDSTSIEATGASFDSIELGKKKTEFFLRSKKLFFDRNFYRRTFYGVAGQIWPNFGFFWAFFEIFLKNIRFSTTQRQNFVHMCQGVSEDVFWTLLDSPIKDMPRRGCLNRFSSYVSMSDLYVKQTILDFSW